MKSYVATFHGDICDIPPVVGSTLNECLERVMEATNFGKTVRQAKVPAIRNSTFPENIGNDRTHPEHYEFHSAYDDEHMSSVEHDRLGDEMIAPDPEDDKIEVWEYDPEEKVAKIVWGFWGWHWTIPDDLEQGKLPGHNKSLYELAMDDY